MYFCISVACISLFLQYVCLHFCNLYFGISVIYISVICKYIFLSFVFLHFHTFYFCIFVIIISVFLYFVFLFLKIVLLIFVFIFFSIIWISWFMVKTLNPTFWKDSMCRHGQKELTRVNCIDMDSWYWHVFMV